MAIRILRRITITCDRCQKLIAKFDAFVKGSELENTGEVICEKCSKTN